MDHPTAPHLGKRLSFCRFKPASISICLQGFSYVIKNDPIKCVGSFCITFRQAASRLSGARATLAGSSSQVSQPAPVAPAQATSSQPIATYFVVSRVSCSARMASWYPQCLMHSLEDYLTVRSCCPESLCLEGSSTIAPWAFFISEACLARA